VTAKEGILTEQICYHKKKSLKQRKLRDLDKPIATWIEKDRLIDKPGDALVIIVNSIGCSWGLGTYGGCSMCGYSNETSEGITTEQLIAQVESALANQSNKSYQSIKLFNSGSFLDEKEIPKQAQEEIMRLFSRQEQVSEIVIETRPEYVSSEKLKRLTKILGATKKLELGIGLESSNDFIRINNINKGFTFKDFKQAVDITLKENVRVKSYLLMKPPFLTETEAMNDTIESAIEVIKIGSRSISINPLNVQNGTLVYDLWKGGIYRPPWFWSLKHVIQMIWGHLKAQGLADKVDRIVSDPSGSGHSRSIHNCRNCDRDFSRIIKDYSVSQDPKLLDQPKCSCYDIWVESLANEEASRDSSLAKVEDVFHLIR